MSEDKQPQGQEFVPSQEYRLIWIQDKLPAHAKVIALLSQVMSITATEISPQERDAIAAWFSLQYTGNPKACRREDVHEA